VILPFFGFYGGRFLGLESGCCVIGADRLNATESPLVLLVVDVVSFVISYCNLGNRKADKKLK